jgi:hypothetical protein
MTMLNGLRRTLSLGLLRLLFSRHGVSVLLACTLLGAVGAARYLDQSPAQVVAHTTAGSDGPEAGCWMPSRAAFAYSPENKMYYCVPYPN